MAKSKKWEDWDKCTPLQKRLLLAIERGLKTVEIDGAIDAGWKADALATWVLPSVARTVNNILHPPRKPQRRKK